MAYVGNTPSKVPLTSADIADSIITSAKIVDGTIVNADINASAGIVASKLSGTGKVLQVVSTSKTDTFSLATGSTYTDITGLSVSITPSSASNKILVMYNVSVGSNGTSGFAYTKLLRGSTSIFVGDTAGSRISASNGGTSISSNVISKHCIQFLDSPSTTSSTTYKIQAYAQVGTAQIYVNRTYSDLDTTGFTRDASSITVMEIAA